MEPQKRISRFAALYQNTINDFIEKPHIVIGCGAIGGPVIRTLGQIGIKELILWDHDTIEVENLGPQGFSPEDISGFKVNARGIEFDELNPSGKLTLHKTKFQRHDNHPEEAFVWLCVDSLSAREFIYKSMMLLNPTKIIDMRMSGLLYQIYCPSMYENSTDPENAYLKTIAWAKENTVQESCSSRSTPHCSMVAASIGINMALSRNAPFSVCGDMLTYKQEVVWG